MLNRDRTSRAPLGRLRAPSGRLRADEPEGGRAAHARRDVPPEPFPDGTRPDGVTVQRGVAIVAAGVDAERARAVVDVATRALVAPPRFVEVVPTIPPRREGGALAWQVATSAGTALPPEPGALAGVILGEVTGRLVDALIADAWNGAPCDAEPPEVLLAGCLLDDPARHVAALADAVGAADVAVCARFNGELRAIASTWGELADLSAAHVSAGLGVPVVVAEGEAGGAVSTWLAFGCAQPGAVGEQGLLVIRFDGARRHDPRQVGWLRATARRLGSELSWHRRVERLAAEHERLRSTAMIDPLTGGWSRDAFERTVMIELAGAARRGEALALVVFDIDQLRHVNERAGHAAGDAALAHVASLIRAHVRVNDELSRFGDDELALLLMGADVDRARPVVEKLVRLIDATPAVVGGVPVRVTVRAGVTGFARDERVGDAAFARAVHACEAAASTSPRVAVCPVDVAVPGSTALDEDAQVASLVGATLGGSYRVLHEISRGATGVVYRAEDVGLGRPVAIKLLRHDLARDRRLAARLHREAAILASIRHPNLIEVYAFRSDDEAYFVMELVEGPSLADLLEQTLAQGERLDPRAAAEVVSEVADALDAMHRAGLIHCDVKPQNVVLDRRGERAVLVDLGESARLGEDRLRSGTPGFAAPESFTEAEETPASDVYGLAATAYVMLTGELPFGDGEAWDVLTRQLDGPPRPPSQWRVELPSAVDTVIAKALSVESRARFATAGAFAAALRAALRATSAPRPVGAAGKLRPLTIDASSLGVGVVADERASVRGAAYRTAVRVLAAFGCEPRVRAVAARSRELGELIAPALSPMSWQPLGALVELARCAGGDRVADVMRAIGRGMVSVTFAHLYGADPTTLTPSGLVAAVPSLWPRYFGFGEVELISEADGRVELRVDADVPAATWDLIAGFLIRVAELPGASDARVELEVEAGACTFVVEWST